MSRLSPDRSALLSLLLDDVTGSKEATEIRQDYCRISDAVLKSRDPNISYYFTGSKSEGLDLPGSDIDIMCDVNNSHCVTVVQSASDTSCTSFDKFLMCTDSDNPCFALLRRIDQQQQIKNLMVMPAIQSLNGIQYLSSDRFVGLYFNISTMPNCNIFNMTRTRTGPSIEQWAEFEDTSKSGMDVVNSIHCKFWPNDALEWVKRPRQYGWPTPHDIASIVDFGCHLVGVGHPRSKTKLLEWRMSFSVAERTLAWSFNHIQMQCYAVMKIILKEFIKERCSAQNQVLCSYFVKTFLFWTYETTRLEFWCETNLSERIMFLFYEFAKCIQEGKIWHYFIPKFNLLSVKLTRAAQTELLHVCDIIIQRDISILKECVTLQNAWYKFISVNDNPINIAYNETRNNFLKDDRLMMERLAFLVFPDMFNDRIDLTSINQFIDAISKNVGIFGPLSKIMMKKDMMSSQWFTLDRVLKHVLPLVCKTDLKLLVVNKLQLEKHVHSLIPLHQGFKNVDKLIQFSDENVSYDLSTSKLWCAIVLLKMCDYDSALIVLTQLLSSIPPFALYEFAIPGCETSRLYAEKFIDSSCTQAQRAGRVWLTDIEFAKRMTEILPLGIQIEQYFSNYLKCVNVTLPPYACAYYLMFLCYHELGQFDNRDCVLRQLTDIFINGEQVGVSHNTFNIAGHCYLITGEIDTARSMFIWSRMCTSYFEASFLERFNSATWYLKNFCAESR